MLVHRVCSRCSSFDFKAKFYNATPALRSLALHIEKHTSQSRTYIRLQGIPLSHALQQWTAQSFIHKTYHKPLNTV